MILSLTAILLAWILPIAMVGTQQRVEIATKPTSETAHALIDPDQTRFYLNLAGPGITLHQEPRSLTDLGVSGIRPDRTSLARRLVTLHAAWWALGCWTLLRLFQHYGSGKILTAESAQRLKHVGLWMIGDWVECNLFQLSKVWLTWLTPGDWFQFYFGEITFAGLFICLIAWIMEEAHLIAEEQSLTV